METPKIEIPDKLHDEIIDAMCAAQADHGPLTKNLDRVFVILGEEFGELAKEILELNRLLKANSAGYSDSEQDFKDKVISEINKRKKLRAEAIQIVATTIHLINGLGVE